MPIVFASYFAWDAEGSCRTCGSAIVCDDYAGYKMLFGERITEAGCLARARRKFYDLWVNHQSAVAEQALRLFGQLYDTEREVHELDGDERRRIR